MGSHLSAYFGAERSCPLRIRVMRVVYGMPRAFEASLTLGYSLPSIVTGFPRYGRGCLLMGASSGKPSRRRAKQVL